MRNTYHYLVHYLVRAGAAAAVLVVTAGPADSVLVVTVHLAAADAFGRCY